LDPPLDRIRAHLALVANRDLYDPDHIDRVAALSVALGRRLGLTDAEIADVEQVARLRDVGQGDGPYRRAEQGEAARRRRVGAAAPSTARC